MLSNEVRNCTACPLHLGCISPTPGAGPSDAMIFLIGQSPGQKEDGKRPFIGPSGKKLRESLSSYGIESVYWTNAVKCHPPGNRKAKVAETDACSPWLQAEIALWTPPVQHLLVVVGEDAAKTLWGRKVKLSELRKADDLEFMGHPAVVIIHPAATLHQPKMNAFYEQDIERIAVRLGVAQPQADYTSGYRLFDFEAGQGCINTDTLGLDTEFRLDNTMIGASVSWADGQAAWIPAGMTDPYKAKDILFTLIGQGSRMLVLHSAQADVPVICKFLDKPLSWWPWQRTIDTAVAAYIHRHPIQLEDLVYFHFGLKKTRFSDIAKDGDEFATLDIATQTKYACGDADYERQLWTNVYSKNLEPSLARPTPSMFWGRNSVASSWSVPGAGVGQDEGARSGRLGFSQEWVG